MDRVYIYEALKSTNTYNPDGVADGGAYTGLTEPPKFDVTTDLLGIVEGLRMKNVPTFSDGNYRAIVSPRFMKHLRANSDFREYFAALVTTVKNWMNCWKPSIMSVAN